MALRIPEHPWAYPAQMGTYRGDYQEAKHGANHTISLVWLKVVNEILIKVYYLFYVKVSDFFYLLLIQ